MLFRVKPRVLVLGGGFAGLEAAFYMRMRMPDQADITLVSDKSYFLFKPSMIYIPFGLDPERLKIKLEKPTEDKDIKFIRAGVRDLDPIARNVGLDAYKLDDYKFHYDYLVVATGAGMRSDEVPGLTEHAHTIWSVEAMLELRKAFADLLEKAADGTKRRVLFLAPPHNGHPGPLYELAFMLDTWLRRKRARGNINISLATAEESYIQAFGPRLNDAVRGEFGRREIEGYRSYDVEGVETNQVLFKNGESLPYDLLVSFPPYSASTPYPALRTDERGFIMTDFDSRRAVNHPEVFAIGDTGTFPVKQAHLALLQADAAADHLSAEVLGTVPEVAFKPVGKYIIEQFDNATFVQAPLRVAARSGGEVEEVEVDTSSEEYRVGSSAAWRAGKKLMGLYLPWRFDSGNPFDMGLPWWGIRAGMNVMSGSLAK